MDIKKLENKLDKKYIEFAENEMNRFSAFNKLKRDIVLKVNCSNCNEHENIHYVWPEGSINSKIMFITPPPTLDETISHVPLYDIGGRLFTVILETLNVKRGEMYITPVCKCSTTDYGYAAGCFGSFLMKELDIVRPKIVVTMGEMTAGIIRTFINEVVSNEDFDSIKDKPTKATLNGLSFTLFHMLDPNEVASKVGVLYNNYKSIIWKEINIINNMLRGLSYE